MKNKYLQLLQFIDHISKLYIKFEERKTDLFSLVTFGPCWICSVDLSRLCYGDSSGIDSERIVSRTKTGKQLEQISVLPLSGREPN